MPGLISDTFTGVDFDPLEGHLPDVGPNPWEGGSAGILFSNTLQYRGFGGSNQPSGNINLGHTASTSEFHVFSIEVTMDTETSADFFFRYSDNNNYIFVELNQLSQKVFIKFRIGTLATAPVTLVALQKYDLRIIDDGLNIEVQLDGATVLEAESDFLDTSSRIALGYNSGSAFGDFQVQFDNLSANYTVAIPPVPEPNRCACCRPPWAFGNPAVTHRRLRWDVVNNRFENIWGADFGKDIAPTGDSILNAIDEIDYGRGVDDFRRVWVNADTVQAKSYQFTDGSFNGITQGSPGTSHDVSARSKVNGPLFAGAGGGLNLFSSVRYFTGNNVGGYSLTFQWGARNLKIVADARIVTPLGGIAQEAFIRNVFAAAGSGFSDPTDSTSFASAAVGHPVDNSVLFEPVLAGDVRGWIHHPNTKTGQCITHGAGVRAENDTYVGFAQDDDNVAFWQTSLLNVNGFVGDPQYYNVLASGGVLSIESIVKPQPNAINSDFFFVSGATGASVTRTIEAYDRVHNGNPPNLHDPDVDPPLTPIWFYDTGSTVRSLSGVRYFRSAELLFAAGDQNENGESVWVFNSTTGALLGTFSHGGTVRSIAAARPTPLAQGGSDDFIDILICGDRVR